MSTTKLFGTDGIRGHIHDEKLRPDYIMRLGQTVALLAHEEKKSRPSITIGRDTRASGAYLQQALVAGISSMGVDCYLAGILPTAALALHSRQNDSCFGIMISASHNPCQDNGLKIFDARGFKIDQSLELRIEEIFYRILCPKPAQIPGRIIEHDIVNNYHALVNKILGDGTIFHGLKLVVDCAHGAAFQLAPSLFQRLSCTTTFLGIEPDGFNINKNAGSEAPGHLIETVRKQGADLGIAFDGDADRVVFVDDTGEIIEGDAVLTLFAIHEQKLGRLHKNTVVSTIMSSVALDNALAHYDIKVSRTDVGDKFVAQKMLEQGFSFGGENSGHLLFFPECTTGDGIFSALKFLQLLKDSGQPASTLKQCYTPSPRILTNIQVVRKIDLSELPKTNTAIVQANQNLKGLGRVMFRYSGTENKARILVEAGSMQECRRITNEITQQFTDEMANNIL